jgi:hypothetical protein
MTTTADRAAAGRLFGAAISRQAAQDAAGARWLTGGRQQQELRDAARGGADAADLVVRAQLDAGMSSDQVDASAEKVLGDRFTDPTQVSDAFYDGYDETADVYAADARDLDKEAG